MIRNLLPTVGSMFRNRAVSTTPESTVEDNVAYLNVHAGVSMGLMAGIDIGANDRWEFFLVGEPLSKVAVAEGQAALGEIVICPESHEFIHPSVESTRAQAAAPGRRKSVANLRLPRANSREFFPNSPKSSNNNNNFNTNSSSSPRNFNNINSAPPPTCTCKRLSNGYFQVSKKHQSAVTIAKKSRTKAKIEMSINLDETYVGTKLMSDIEEDLEFAFQTLKNSATKCMAQLQQTLNEKAHITPEAVPALNSIIRNKMMSPTGKAILFSVMLS
eukprot:gene38138-47075_t